MTAAMEAGKIAVTNDASLVIDNDLIDVVIDATGVPAVGAEIGLRAMEHGKHLVMMNVEADVTIGAYLKSEADRLGVVYSLGAGDEPSSCMELIEFVSAHGPSDRRRRQGQEQPAQHRCHARRLSTRRPTRRHMNVRMLVEFVDGSKTMVEMAAIANATGLVPDKPGMHGPAATLDELSKVLVPQKDGGVLSQGRRRRLFDRQGRRARRLRRRRHVASAHLRAHGRSEDGQGPLLHLPPALSPDLARSAADLRPRRALRQGRHGAAGQARRRGLRRRQEGSEARREARCDRRISATAPGS